MTDRHYATPVAITAVRATAAKVVFNRRIKAAISGGR